MHIRQSHTSYRRACKQYARQAFARNVRLCLRASTAATALSLALTWLQLSFGHTLYYYLLTTADTQAQTGFQIGCTGFSAVLRLDMAQAVLAVQFTWGEFLPLLLEQLLILVASLPLFYGAMEALCGVLRGKSGAGRELLGWYLSPEKLGKALAVDLPLRFLQLASRLLGMLPGLALLSWANGQNSGLSGGEVDILNALSVLLMLLGAAVLYFPVSQLLPARYVLAARPELTVKQVYQTCWKLLRGRRVEYYVFCLTFVFWAIGNSLCYGALELYLLPYLTMTNEVYLHLIPAKGEENDVSGVFPADH